MNDQPTMSRLSLNGNWQSKRITGMEDAWHAWLEFYETDETVWWQTNKPNTKGVQALDSHLWFFYMEMAHETIGRYPNPAELMNMLIDFDNQKVLNVWHDWETIHRGDES